MNETTPITSQQVADFLTAQTEKLRSKAKSKGYYVLHAEAQSFSQDEAPTVTFTAYNSDAGHSFPCATAEDAIAEIVRACKGRTASELKRETAAKLLREAEELDAITAASTPEEQPQAAS